MSKECAGVSAYSACAGETMDGGRVRGSRKGKTNGTKAKKEEEEEEEEEEVEEKGEK